MLHSVYSSVLCKSLFILSGKLDREDATGVFELIMWQNAGSH